MPDADDFDVESLRALLKGGGEKPRTEAAPPAKPSSPRASKKTTAKGTTRPKPRRKS